MLLIKYSFIAFIVLSIAAGFFRLDSDDKIPKNILGKTLYFAALVAGLSFFAGVIAWLWTMVFSLKSLLVIAGLFIGSYALLFGLIFVFFNVGRRSEKKIRRLREVSTNTDRIRIEKIDTDNNPKKTKYSHEDYINLEYKDDKIWYIDGKNTVFCKSDYTPNDANFKITDDMRRASPLLERVETKTSDNESPEAQTYTGYLLTSSGIHEFNNPNTVKETHQWNDPDITSIGFSLDINDDYFLMTTGTDRSKSFKEKIWQVSKNDFSRKLINDDAYTAMDIASRIIKPSGLDGIILAVYHGDLDWGYGGFCSRPKFSTLILFNKENEDGLELATFSFSAGTVMDISYASDTQVFTIACDPSRPPGANKLKNLDANNYTLRIL